MYVMFICNSGHGIHINFQVSVSLQPEEILNTSSPAKVTKTPTSKDTSSRSMTVARYHEVTVGLTHSQLILAIPLHITPAFEAEQGNFKLF